MKKDGKYRFNLQFPAETEEQIAAGELLEKLGNKKSAVVVQALYDFAVAHPEVFRGNGKIIISTTQTLPPEKLEPLINHLVDAQLERLGAQTPTITSKPDEPADVADMLDNLDIFG